MAATDGRSPAVVDVEEQRWRRVEMAMAKLKDITDEESATKFSTEDYLDTYTAIYDLCLARPKSRNNQAELYALYRMTLEDYLASTVVPSLWQKQDKLRELALQWSNYKAMVRRLSACFGYLDRTRLLFYELPTLGEVSLDCFRTLAFHECSVLLLKDALMDLMRREREGGEIDRTLMKKIFDFLVEMDYASME